MMPLLLISTHYTLYRVRYGRLEKQQQFGLDEVAQLHQCLTKSRQPVRILDWYAQASLLRIAIPALKQRDRAALAAHHLRQHFPEHPYLGWRAHRDQRLYPQALHPSAPLSALLALDTVHSLLLAGLHTPAQLLPPPQSSTQVKSPAWQLLQWQTSHDIWSVLSEEGIPAFCQRDYADSPEAIDLAAQRIRQHAAQQGWFAQDHALARHILDLGRDEQDDAFHACLTRLAKHPPEIDHLPPQRRRPLRQWRLARMTKRVACLVFCVALGALAQALIDDPSAPPIPPLIALSPEAYSAWQSYEQDWALWMPPPPTPYTVLNGIALAISGTGLPLQQLAWQNTEDEAGKPGARIQLQFEPHDEIAFLDLAQRLNAATRSTPAPSLEYTWTAP